MTSPLPGMPMRAGDPGVFVCGPDDIAPWERGQAPAAPPAAPPAGPVPSQVWLVLRLCPSCTGRYCPEHDERNWWLTTWGTWARKGNRTGSTP